MVYKIWFLNENYIFEWCFWLNWIHFHYLKNIIGKRRLICFITWYKQFKVQWPKANHQYKLPDVYSYIFVNKYIEYGFKKESSFENHLRGTKKLQLRNDQWWCMLVNLHTFRLMNWRRLYLPHTSSFVSGICDVLLFCVEEGCFWLTPRCDWCHINNILPNDIWKVYSLFFVFYGETERKRIISITKLP